MYKTFDDSNHLTIWLTAHKFYVLSKDGIFLTFFDVPIPVTRKSLLFFCNILSIQLLAYPIQLCDFVKKGFFFLSSHDINRS